MLLTLVRHGEPARGVPGQEHRDPPLTETGRQQVLAVAPLVRADGYDALYCSHLLRARQSAQLLAAPGGHVRVEPDLAEFDRDANYLHWEDGADIWQRYLSGDLSPWGTTLDGFRARVLAVVERLRGEHPEGRVTAVCHGGVINAVLAWVLGVPHVVAPVQPGYATLTRFSYRDDEGWAVIEVNAGP